jgi:GNAT superfamily N-acetyltransferase
MASLTLGSMNFPTQASVNSPETIRALAAGMRERGIKPELEIFDLGMADYARHLVKKGDIGVPAYANILLGSLGTANASPENLVAIVRALPDDTTWAAAGIGRYQLPMNQLAIAMGGHVRVGLEDNLWMDPLTKTDPASNVRLIERLVAIAETSGRAVASPSDARRIIGLPPSGAGIDGWAGEIVDCDPARLPDLFALRAEVWIEEGADPEAFPGGQWINEHDAHRRHWVVMDDGRLVAGASLCLHASLAEVEEPEAYSMLDPPRGGLIAAPDKVVVRRPYRKHGLAQALLDRQDEAARAAGAVLAVRQASPAMRRLLERRGWQYHGPGPADTRFPGVEWSVMTLRL